MAQRRMISRSIAEDDRFVDMQPISKLLYFYLVLNADDDGFVGSVKMINFLTGAKQENYTELLNNNLILQPSSNSVYVITDWYTQNKIEAKIYKPTTYLSIRALLYIKSDFAYTTNPNADEVIAPANSWIKNGRDKKTPPEIQSQQYLQQIEDTSKKVPRSVEETSSNLLAQNRLDKNRPDKSRSEQTREDQSNKDKNRSDKDITSSNGGMGEKSSYPHDEIKIGNGNFITQINQIMGTKIPEDDKRLTTLFDDVSDRYKDTFIKQGLAKLLTSIQDGRGQLPDGSVKNLVIDHLPESIKAVTTGEESH